VAQAYANEFLHKDAEERAICIGVAQTFGEAFIAWVPGKQSIQHTRPFSPVTIADFVTLVVILDVGKYAPKFTMGYSVMCGVSLLQIIMIFVLRYCVKWENAHHGQEEKDRLEVEDEKADTAKGPSNIIIAETI
jgi:ACS family pantothenate transporter-like MFS transporter